MRARRGWAALGALMAVLALTVLVSVGFRARDRDLAFEDRAARRAQARWAAESAAARGVARSRVGRGPTVSGALPATPPCARVRYRLERAGRGLRATGWCDDAPPVSIDLRIERGRVVEWVE